MDLSMMGAADLSRAVHEKRVSAVEVARYFLQRVESLDAQLNCFLHMDAEDVIRQATLVDQAVAQGSAGTMPMCGVPIAIKDMIVTKDMRTTAASRILEHFIPPYDATLVERLRAAGAIIFGKTNMDEFAMGSSTENSAFYPSKNPWDVQRIPGGSSGGSAAAVAARLAPVSLGTDTGGSIRQPASMCGVVGMKPTYGRVSRYGVIAFASSLDQVGPFGTTAEDVALVLQTIGGHDPKDATSIPDAMPNLLAACKKSIKGLRVGVPKEYFEAGLDPIIRTHVEAAIDALVKDGAKVVPVSLPHTKYAIATYYMIATAEASSNLARYDGVRYGLRTESTAGKDELSLAEMYAISRGTGFGTEVKRRILLGTYVLRSGFYDAYYKRASQVRSLIRRDFLNAFSSCDVIATPASPIPAFRLHEKVSDPIAMYLSDIYTISCNLAGLPGISIPCGFVASETGTSLPVGLQLLGPPLGEEALFQAAAQYQRLTDFHKQVPPQVL